MEVSAVFIKSLKTGGHFRAGRFFADSEAFWPVNEFSVEEMEKLQNDPRLDVSFGTLPENFVAPANAAKKPLAEKAGQAKASADAPAKAKAAKKAPKGKTADKNKGNNA